MKLSSRQYMVIFFLLPVPMLLYSTTLSAQTKAAWIAPQSAVATKNPLAGDPSGLSAAKTLYTTNCTPCHGAKGKGDCPAAASLNPKPADHTSSLVQSETDGSLFWKISEGHTPMPQYKAAFSETQRWELVNYIRTLAKSSSKK